jgi:hypothetical protein
MEQDAMKILVAAIGLSLLAGSAAASEPSNATDKSNKIVCRTESAVGSRLAKTRVCRTLAEWAELRRQTRDTVQGIQDRRPARISDDAGGM